MINSTNSLLATSLSPQPSHFALPSSPNITPSKPVRRILHFSESRPDSLLDPTASPVPPPAARRIIRLKCYSAPLPTKQSEKEHEGKDLSELSPPLAQPALLVSPKPTSPVKVLHSPKTPASLPHAGESPLTTPKKRYNFYLTKKRRWSVKGCFSPKTQKVLKKYQEEGRQVIYSLKGAQHDATLFRYTGTSQRILKRASQHATSASNPKGPSLLRQQEKALLKTEGAALSIGILAVAPTVPTILQMAESSVSSLENRAIEKCKKAHPDTLVNQRKGGGGGVAVQEKPTLSDKVAEQTLQKLLEQPLNWTTLYKEGSYLRHRLSQQNLAQKKAIYVFERTIGSNKKRYVGLSGKVKKRLSTHLSHGNHPEAYQGKEKDFYQDLHSDWKQFKLSLIPIQDLLQQGATIHQLEPIAIKLLDGLHGYNKNAGGGGGACR